jgi:membrane-associated phospholipid phosphatase
VAMKWRFVLALALLGMPVRGAFAETKVDPFFAPRPEFYGPQIEPLDVSPDEQAPPNLVKQIGMDFKNVFTTKENLAIVSVGLAAAWGASHFDHSIANSGFNAELNEGSALDATFDPGSRLGGAAVQFGGAVAAFGIGKLISDPELESLGRDLVRAQIVTQALTQAVKFSVGRERPDGSNHQSFPSGHSASAFATATVLERHYGWKVGVPAYAFAGYVAASRLNEDRHYLSDVVFGASIGILVGRTVTVGIGRARFAVSPTFQHGGAGVQFTWLGSGADGRPARR